MAAPSHSPARLVADVGGTNSRLALFDPASGRCSELRVYRNRDFDCLEAVIDDWLEKLAAPRPAACCLAVAAPPAGDRVVMSNLDWSFSCRELAGRYGFAQMRCLNDFQANAYALPHLDSGDVAALRPGAGSSARLATVGPGTGLGGAILDRSGDSPTAHCAEPGHMGLSPGTALELEVFRVLLSRHSDVYAELLVSGPGLQRLHAALAEVHGETPLALPPADITRRALRGDDPPCTRALATFCALLGSVCGDFVLATGAYGGLYLAGGIVPHIVDFLRASAFAQRFQTKGAMAGHLRAVPLYAITAAQPGLLGAAHAPLAQAPFDD